MFRQWRIQDFSEEGVANCQPQRRGATYYSGQYFVNCIKKKKIEPGDGGDGLVKNLSM